MRYAVLSDIHSNLPALESVLESIDCKNVDRIVCCGDLVGYFTFPNECINLCRANNIFSIAGNHDLGASGVESNLTGFWEVARTAIYWTQDHLSGQNMRYLENLPRTSVIDNGFILFHGSIRGEPFPEMVRINDVDQAVIAFQEMAVQFSDVRLGFFGHIHRPCVFRLKGGNISLLEESQIDLEKNRDTKYLVNSGSVGLSRDGDPRASYLIYDSSSGTLSFVRVDFDNSLVIREARKEGLLERRYRRLTRRYLKRIKNKLLRLTGNGKS